MPKVLLFGLAANERTIAFYDRAVGSRWEMARDTSNEKKLPAGFRRANVTHIAGSIPFRYTEATVYVAQMLHEVM